MTTELFISKVQKWLYNFVGINIIILPVCLSFTYDSLPSCFYETREGIIQSIKECTLTYRLQRGTYYADVYEFSINTESDCYIDERKKIEMFGIDNLLHKKIKYKTKKHIFPVDSYKRTLFYELKYLSVDGKIVYSIDDQLNFFIEALICSLISLIWCCWAFARLWKKIKSGQKTDRTGGPCDEYYFDTWSVCKKKSQYQLSYISKIDGSIHQCAITEDEFNLAKDGHLNLDDFYSRYNLW